MDSDMNLIGSAVSIPSDLPTCDMRRLQEGDWSLYLTLCPFYLETVHSHQYGFSK